MERELAVSFSKRTPENSGFPFGVPLKDEPAILLVLVCCLSKG